MWGWGLREMDKHRKIAAECASRLIASRYTIATAESCTGGLITSVLSETPGISKSLLGGFVTYSNDLKMKVLSVPQTILENHGAVSQETVECMIQGLHRVTHADICVATSGIAGPGGGTELKPVGTVWIGLGFKGNTHAVTLYQFEGDRISIQRQAAVQVCALVLKILEKE